LLGPGKVYGLVVAFEIWLRLELGPNLGGRRLNGKIGSGAGNENLHRIDGVTEAGRVRGVCDRTLFGPVIENGFCSAGSIMT
jgi:hypothetical protein